MKLLNQSPAELVRDAFWKDLRAFSVCICTATALPAFIIYLSITKLQFELSEALAHGFLVWTSINILMIISFMYFHHRRLQDRLSPIAERASLGENAATVAHDLRTPLLTLRTAMRHLVNEEGLSDKAQDCMQLATRSAERVARISQDFLDVLENTARKQQLTNVNDIFEALIAEYNARPELRAVTFTHRSDITHPVMHGIPTHIERMVANIMGNAIEAMEKQGQITTRVVSTEEKLNISITDTGCGMTQEQIDSILAAQGHTQGKADGHGIGLQFVLQTIEQHEGTLAIDSTLGEGATFTIRFPRAEAEAGKVLQFKRAENS